MFYLAFVIIFAFSIGYLFFWSVKEGMKFNGKLFFCVSCLTCLLGIASNITDCRTIRLANDKIISLENERDILLDFIKSTQEYSDKMTAFASLDAGDLVFGTDGEVYIVTKVHEPEGDTMPDVECRDLTLSSDIRIFIEGKDGWRYTTMKQEDELYRSTVTNVLVPLLPLPHL
jgi:hypothetical protein